MLLSSTAGLSASPTASLSYSVSKAAVAALPRILAPDLASSQVLINAVAPGKFFNPDWPDDPEKVKRYEKSVPLGRLASAAEVAALIGFLSSSANTYVTGQTFSRTVDGFRLCRRLRARSGALTRSPPSSSSPWPCRTICSSAPMWRAACAALSDRTSRTSSYSEWEPARPQGLVVRAVGARIVPVPILVESSYEIPACVGKRSLVIAVSGSGDTDEVNHAALVSAERGAQIAVVTVGGWLLDFAENYGAQSSVSHKRSSRRARRSAWCSARCSASSGAGFLPKAGAWIESAAFSSSCAETNSPRKAISLRASLRAGCRHVLCQGDTPIGVAAAERWKAQINQNARQAASVSEQPNASHNEAVAWDCRNDLTMERNAAVLLRQAMRTSG